MGRTAKTEQELLEEATGWILRLEGLPKGSHVFKDFEAWLATSEENRAAWDRVNETWRLLEAAKPGYTPHERRRTPPIFKSPSATVTHSSARAIGARNSYLRSVVGGTLVAAAFVLWIAVPFALVALRADYRTAAGQTERVRMADGSLVELGGMSAIKADIGTAERHVTLLAGQAFFDVAPDRSRPFVIDAEGVEIKVIGTAFDVQVTSQSTTIALLHGSVEAVAEASKPRAQLKPGEMLIVDRGTGDVSIKPVALEDIGSWRNGQIFVTDATVGSVIEILQRYHSAWISIPDRGLANRKVSGLFDLRDPDRALHALVEPFGGKVRSVTRFARVVTRL